MKRPPRDPDQLFFGRKKILYSVFEGLLLFFMVMGVYFFSINEGHTEGEVRAIAFSSLIIGNVFLIITKLSKTRSFLAVIVERNIALLIILFAALLMLVLVISIPALQIIFNFRFPGYKHFITSVAGATAILLILETVKYISYRKSLRR